MTTKICLRCKSAECQRWKYHPVFERPQFTQEQEACNDRVLARAEAAEAEVAVLRAYIGAQTTECERILSGDEILAAMSGDDND